MKKALLALAGTLLAVPLHAQSVDLSTPGAWTSTFFGCDPGRSCHRIVFTMAPDPHPDYDWIRGTVAWQSWFFVPGIVRVFLPYPQALSGWDVWNDYIDFRWYDELTVHGYMAQGEDTPISYVIAGAVYGPLGGYIGEDDESYGRVRLEHMSTTYVTPEPASLLLVGTGLAGLLGAARRRRATLRRSNGDSE